MPLPIEHHRKVMMEITCNQNVMRPGFIPWWLKDTTHIRVIAVKGAVDDWAAYAGSAAMDADEVQRNGGKLPVEVAAELFPILKPEKYRR